MPLTRLISFEIYGKLSIGQGLLTTFPYLYGSEEGLSQAVVTTLGLSLGLLLTSLKESSSERMPSDRASSSPGRAGICSTRRERSSIERSSLGGEGGVFEAARTCNLSIFLVNLSSFTTSFSCITILSCRQRCMSCCCARVAV